MAVYFADTSAIAKLYVPEVGSTWLLSIDLRGVSLSALALVEMASVLARHQREGALTGEQLDLAWRAFTADVEAWTVVRLTDDVLRSAASALLRHSQLRTLDAIQLACALEAERRARRSGAGRLVFLTADMRLEAEARRVGLETDNPNQH